MNERIYECELCGHAYTRSYGRWYVTCRSERWLCHPCAEAVGNRRKQVAR